MIDRAKIEAVLDPLQAWAHNCHAASIHLVRSGAIDGPCRVARGACEGVGGQHSWVVLGDDCYDRDAKIVDPTLWSYDAKVEGVWYGSMRDGRHHPHGMGMIWDWGRPNPAVGSVIELTPSEPFSDEASMFLDLLGPLDREGWTMLAHAPVEGWPAAEIIAAMCETEIPDRGGATFEALIPVDIVGMLTDRNPGNAYLPERA